MKLISLQQGITICITYINFKKYVTGNAGGVTIYSYNGTDWYDDAANHYSSSDDGYFYDESGNAYSYHD